MQTAVANTCKFESIATSRVLHVEMIKMSPGINLGREKKNKIK